MTEAKHTKEVRRRVRVLITRVSNIMHRRLIELTDEPHEDFEMAMLNLHANDLRDLLRVLYLARAGLYRAAVSRWRNLDTEVREHIPESFIEFIERKVE